MENLHHVHRLTTSSSAIAERPRHRVGQFWPKSKTDTGRRYFADTIGLSSTTVA